VLNRRAVAADSRIVEIWNRRWQRKRIAALTRTDEMGFGSVFNAGVREQTAK
jgi:hypothetical protein